MNDSTPSSAPHPKQYTVRSWLMAVVFLWWRFWNRYNFPPTSDPKAVSELYFQIFPDAEFQFAGLGTFLTLLSLWRYGETTLGRRIALCVLCVIAVMGFWIGLLFVVTHL